MESILYYRILRNLLHVTEKCYFDHLWTNFIKLIIHLCKNECICILFVFKASNMTSHFKKNVKKRVQWGKGESAEPGFGTTWNDIDLQKGNMDCNELLFLILKTAW